MKKITGWKKKVMLLLASFIVSVVLIEILARIFLGGAYPMDGDDPKSVKDRFLRERFSSQLFQRNPDRKICFDLIPGSLTSIPTNPPQRYSINSRGLRGPDIVEKKPEDVRRIVLLGDSFVFGWGEDDNHTLSSEMECILNGARVGDESYQVINSGIPGYNVAQMKELFIRNSSALDPDIVVLVVSANDLVSDYLHFNTLFKCLYEDFLPLPYSWKPFLWRISVAYRLLVQKHKIPYSADKFNEKDITFFGEEVRAIEMEVKKRGMEFLPVILPMLEPFNNYPYEKQHHQMREALTGLDYVDLLSLMRGWDVEPLWFLPDDHHLNKKANRAVSRIILSLLAGRDMIKLKENFLPKNPLKEALYQQGDLIVADKDADPEGRGGFPGAIFKVDKKSGKITVVSADPALKEPVDLVFDQTGNLLVLDAKADPDNIGASGAVFCINRFTGRAEKVLSSKVFILPNALLLDEDQKIYISEKHYNPEGLDTATGALLVYDPESGNLKVLASGAAFKAPGAIVFAPDNKLYFIDADSNPNNYRGTLCVLYEVDRDTGEFRTLVEFKETASPVGIVPLPDGSLIVIDANADLLKKEVYLGGLLRVYPKKKTYEFIHLSTKFLDPTRGDLGTDGAVYFTDANADPNRLGPDGVGQGVNGTGPGAVWRYDYIKDELSLIVSAKPFVNPMSLKIVPRDY